MTEKLSAGVGSSGEVVADKVVDNLGIKDEDGRKAKGWRNGSISGGAGVARSGASLRRRRRASVCASSVVERRRCGVKMVMNSMC